MTTIDEEINDYIRNKRAYDQEEVTPQDLLKFAKMILLSIMGIFILSMLGKLLLHDAIIFEACKTILPSIATSVIGFYFGRSS